MYIQSYEKKGSVSPQKAEPCEQGFSLGFSPILGDVETLISVRIEDETGKFSIEVHDFEVVQA